MSGMSNQGCAMNDIKGAGTNSSEGLSSDRCPTEQQGRLGRHRTATKGGRRRKWSQEVNQIVMESMLNQNGMENNDH